VPFKFNLRRHYSEGNSDTVGLYKLNSVDLQLESDWFQTLTLEHQSWFQNVPFTCILRRYNTGDSFAAAPDLDHANARVGEELTAWLNWLKNDVGFAVRDKRPGCLY
jgi:hypothetical protein